MKHWSEYPSQAPAHRRRVRKQRELMINRDAAPAEAKLAAIRQLAAERCGLPAYPAELIRRYESGEVG